jgi:hypothetical protein
MNEQNIKYDHKKILTAAIVFAGMLFGGMYQKSESASLTNVSVTLSNSRLSFTGALAAGNTVGTSQAIIDTTDGDWASTTSAQLVSGDLIGIGDTNSIGAYTITSVDSASTVNLTPVLLAGDVEAGDIVISTQSATQTVRFTTANAIANGTIRILVPALDDDTNAQDGLPDSGNFDFGNSAPTVTCPIDLTGYDFVTGTATASAITIDSQDYHSFECRYSGTGAISTAFDGSSNDAIVINDLINPAPKINHATGLADTYRIVVQHLNSSFATQDSTATSIGVIEAVRVTASVAPQITFQISGVAASTTACGVTTDVTTTAAAVPLGELSISVFTDAAQALAVSTNATNGYVVTVRANDQLGRDAGTCAGDNTGSECIPDSVGENASMTHASSDEWDVTSVKGFGFSLDNVNTSGLTPVFEYDTVAGDCTGAYCARQFADTENIGADVTQTPQTIFSSSSVADEHNLYVCYRAIISATQSAGEYENHLIYTATATF